MKKRILIIAAALLLSVNSVFAQNSIDTDKSVSVSEKSDVFKVDNSDLQVDVFQYTDGNAETIYSGLLGGYAGGKWRYLDFSEVQLWTIVDWNSTEDKYICIIPRRSSDDTFSDENQEDNQTNNVEQNNSIAVTYDVIYTISGRNMNITYSIDNPSNTNQTVNTIAALYKNGILQKVILTPLTLNRGVINSGNISMILPESDAEQCSVKMMVWDSALRPLGNAKNVNDVEPYLREKTIAVSEESGKEFNLYMKAENVIGGNTEAEHIIKYNPQKFALVDLCGLTYEKELSPGKIENTGITVKSVDTEHGEIVFNFDLPEGRNTGTNNIVKFKALSGVSEEEIIYKIQ